MLLQALILNRLIKANHRPTIQIALSKFYAYMTNKVEIHPDLRGLVCAAVAKSNSSKAIADLKSIIETINFSEVLTNCSLIKSRLYKRTKITQSMITTNFLFFPLVHAPQNLGCSPTKKSHFAPLD